MQIHRKTSSFGTKPVTDRTRQSALSAKDALYGWHHPCYFTPGFLPSALRACLRQYKIAPGDLVEPLDFISRLAALVPKPRVNLTCYHGVFAPNSQHRARVTPARRGRGNKAKASGPEAAQPVASHVPMSWAQRLKRVFNIDIETCSVCGGSMKVIACIEDPLVIKKILTHLRGKGLYLETGGLPESRAPPQGDLFS